MDPAPEHRTDAGDDLMASLAVRRLQDTYADVITRRAWHELVGIMTPGCTLELSLGDRTDRHVGPQAIGAFIDGAVARFSFFEMAVLNAVVDVDVEAGRAGGRMFTVELRQNVDDGRRTDAYGVYQDRIVRGDDGRWRFAHRLYQSFARDAEPGSSRDMDVFEVDYRDLSSLH